MSDKINKLIAVFLVVGMFCLALAVPVFAARKKFMTKGDAIALLSASDFMKKKIGALLSWTIGYDISKVNRARLVPIINYIIAVPKKAPPDGRTVIELQASVDDPGGLANIQGVRADLSSIGKLTNMMLVDNGLWGDRLAADGIYTIQTNVSRAVALGKKEISIAVANKKGWVAMGETSLLVLKKLQILEAKSKPTSIVSGSKRKIAIYVGVLSPDAAEKVTRVFVNLSGLGGDEVFLLKDDGRGADRYAGDYVYSAEVEIDATGLTRTIEIPVYAEGISGAADYSTIKLKIIN